MTAAATQDSLIDLLRGWSVERPADTDENVSSSARVPLPDYLPRDANGVERPGEYPYTRGRSPRGYLDQLWVMGQYSGYASASATNRRFKDLLAAGQTGLSIALDLPTQLGLDSDDPRAVGEVGRVGVPLDTVEDVLALLDGIPLDKVRQMRTTANAIGPMFAAMLLVALEELGQDPNGFRLLLQNDVLKEFSARGTYIFPPRPSMRLSVDVVEYFANEYPGWEPIEFCGYHIRDAGATAVQEIAYASMNGIAYLDAALERGVSISSLAHRLFLFMSAGVDVFEEAAKLRAARRLWAKILHERYGVPREDAAINLFVYTLGGSLVAQEPLNNAIRVAYEALGAVLGGVQTLAASSFDEALGLPSSEAAHLSLRTQQIIAHESGATKVVDPLAGSYYVEEMTNRIEEAAVREMVTVTELGGAVAVLESGWLAASLADSAYELQIEIDERKRPIVGVNVHEVAASEVARVFQVPPEEQAKQCQRLGEIRAARDDQRVAEALAEVTRNAAEGRNVIPSLIEAARARATMGEITKALRQVFGDHHPSPIRL